MIYNKFYNNGVTYCGFIKPHPHIAISILRVGFANTTNETSVVSILSTIADDAISIYDKIGKNFQSVVE
jgi:DNA-directed RNA polymerase subunit L